MLFGPLPGEWNEVHALTVWFKSLIKTKVFKREDGLTPDSSLEKATAKPLFQVTSHTQLPLGFCHCHTNLWEWTTTAMVTIIKTWSPSSRLHVMALPFDVRHQARYWHLAVNCNLSSWLMFCSWKRYGYFAAVQSVIPLQCSMFKSVELANTAVLQPFK